MSLSALGRLAIVGAFGLLTFSTTYAMEATLTGTVGGDNGASNHTIKVMADEQVVLVLEQTPVEGGGCLAWESFHMWVYEAPKIRVGPSAPTSKQCVQELLYRAKKDGTVDVAVKNYSKDPAFTVSYTLKVTGAESAAPAMDAPKAAEASPAPAPAATALPGPAASGFGPAR